VKVFGGVGPLFLGIGNEGDRLSQTVIRDVGFNSYPAYSLEGSAPEGAGKAR